MNVARHRADDQGRASGDRSNERALDCLCRSATVFSDLFLLYLGELEKMFQESDFQRRVTMDWNRQANHFSLFTIDVVTPVNTKQNPTVLLNDSCKLPP